MRRIIYTISIILIIIIVGVLFIRNYNDRSYREVVVFVKDGSLPHNLLQYNNRNEVISRNRVNFQEVSYNVDEDSYIVLESDDESQIISEIRQYHNEVNAFIDKNKIYSDTGISNINVVPNTNKISYMKNNSLCVYDPEIDDVVEIVQLDDLDTMYVWLNESKVMFVDENKENHSNIILYDIDEDCSELTISDATNIYTSNNRQYIAYRSEEKNRVTIYDVINKIVMYEIVKEYNFLINIPSNDGQYLLSSVSNGSESKVIVVNCKNGKENLISAKLRPDYMIWN